MMAEGIRNMRANGFRRRDSPSNLRIPISNVDDKLILGHRFRQRAQYIHKDKF